MRLFTLIIYLTFFSKGVFAQTASISVKVSAAGVPVDAATVSLLQTADSTWIMAEMTDGKGMASFHGVALGKYILTASYVGHKAGMQPIELIEAREYTSEIELEKESTSLGEVAITAKKPFIETAPGKTIVNIEGATATTSSNVLELMGRLPGVLVDQNGAITMRGKNGVLVLIDDRPTYLTGDDLAAYLKTITADEAAQIELVTQPGARYDAAGNTGIINIKLRKSKKPGWNGNASLSWQQGVYYNRSESFMLNYRKNKLNILLNGSDMEAIGFAAWTQEMYYTDSHGNVTGSNINRSSPKERFSHTTLRLGIDYNLSDKTTIGMNIRGAYHPNKMYSYVPTTYRDYINGTTTYSNTLAAEGHIRKEVVTNAYVSHKFSKEHTLDVNVDYLTYSKNADQEITSTRYNDQMQPLQAPVIINSMQQSPINIYSFKADHAIALTKGLKIESGIKASRVTMDFDANFHLFENNAWINDTGRTNHFLYSEHISAGYLTLAKELNKKWEARIGLRAEHTSASGLQYVRNDRFTRNYTSLFPTVFVTYKHDPNNHFELNYGRRVDRPEYRQLNPFVYYSFQNMYNVGNPALMPQYANNVELKHSFKNTIITTLSYSGTTDVIQGYVTVEGPANTSYNRMRNIAANNYCYLSVNVNKDLYKWWSLNFYASVFYATFEGMFNNARKKAEWSRFSIHSSSRFDMGKGWKAEFIGWYNSKGRWSLTSAFDPIFGFDIGASKKINDSWSARFFAHDPLYIFRLNARDYGANYFARTTYRNASQSFSLAITYTFGSAQNEHNEKSLDEAKRL